MVNVCKEGKIAAAYDFRRRSNVSCTENGLGLVTTPSAVGGVPDIVESFMFLTFFLINHSLLYKLNYRFKEPLAFSHQEKYMTTFKCEHFRILDACVHFFSQIIGDGLIFLSVHNKRWNV